MTTFIADDDWRRFWVNVERYGIPPQIQPDPTFTNHQPQTRINPSIPQRNQSQWFAFKEKPMATRTRKHPVEKVIGSTVGEKISMSEDKAASATTAPSTAAPVKAKESIRFHVRRRLDGNVLINSSIPIDQYPKPEMLVAALPVKHRKSIMEWYRRNSPYVNLEVIIQTHWGTVTAEEWAEALCTAAIRVASLSTEAECTASAPVKNVFMAIDDTLYKLSPVSMLGTNRALATVRKRALAEAKTAGDIERAAAKAFHDTTIKEANNTASAIYAKAQTVQSEIAALKASIKNLPPQWLVDAGYPVLYAPGGWRVVLAANLKITQFVYEDSIGGTHIRRKWAALTPPTTETQRSLIFYYSAAIGEAFSVSNMRTLGNVYLPHITPEKSCMQPADAPTTLKTTADIARLIEAVNRCLSSVDLHSMLTHPHYWDGRMWWYVPDDLKKLLAPHNNWADALRRFCAPENPETGAPSKELRAERAVEVINVNEERKETWTA